MERNRIISLTAVVLATVALAALVVYVSLPKPNSRPLPPGLGHILLPEARELKPFTLTDINGHSFDLNSLQGKWTFVFFGYTHCPDICPTTLNTLRGTARQLEQADGVLASTQFVFISVDPKRDNPGHLKQYLAYFHPDFLGATGDKEQIDNLARQLGAMYMFDGDTSGDGYIVNHSATIMLIDPHARWVGRFNPPHRSVRIADDFRQLHDYFLNN